MRKKSERATELHSLTNSFLQFPLKPHLNLGVHTLRDHYPPQRHLELLYSGVLGRECGAHNTPKKNLNFAACSAIKLFPLYSPSVLQNLMKLKTLSLANHVPGATFRLHGKSRSGRANDGGLCCVAPAAIRSRSSTAFARTLLACWNDEKKKWDEFGNTTTWYVMEMAEKRAMSRAVLKLTGFYELGVFGEDESEDFKRK